MVFTFKACGHGQKEHGEGLMRPSHVAYCLQAHLLHTLVMQPGAERPNCPIQASEDDLGKMK